MSMREVQKIMRKIRRINQRGLLRRAKYSANTRFMQMQVEGGQALDNLEHLEPFGFTSHPLAGAEGIVLSFNGNGSHSVVFCVGDRRYRLEVNEGEVAIYNHHGDKVHIKEDRTIDIDAATQVNLNTPNVHCSGNLTAAGIITGKTVKDSAGIVLGSHTHTGDSGGSTGGPR